MWHQYRLLLLEILWYSPDKHHSSFLLPYLWLRNRAPWVSWAPVLVKWQAKRSMFRGWTFQANLMKIDEYRASAEKLMKKISASLKFRVQLTRNTQCHLPGDLQSTMKLIKITTIKVYNECNLLHTIFTSFWVSAIAARGIPQLATGPQKWVL